MLRKKRMPQRNRRKVRMRGELRPPGDPKKSGLKRKTKDPARPRQTLSVGPAGKFRPRAEPVGSCSQCPGASNPKPSRTEPRTFGLQIEFGGRSDLIFEPNPRIREPSKETRKGPEATRSAHSSDSCPGRGRGASTLP